MAGSESHRCCPAFVEILDDVSSWTAPAECMPKRAMIRGASDEADNDQIVEADQMLSKPGFQLAVSPQWAPSQGLDVLVMRLPFQEEGMLRSIWIWRREWDTHQIFECVICMPVTRDHDSSIVCYNGAHVQRVQIGHQDNMVFLHRVDPTDCHCKTSQDLSHVCYTMSTTFLNYLQSI